jgi:hypothetical protein
LINFSPTLPVVKSIVETPGKVVEVVDVEVVTAVFFDFAPFVSIRAGWVPDLTVVVFTVVVFGPVAFGAFGAPDVFVTFGALAEEAFTGDGPGPFEPFGAASTEPTTRATRAATAIVDFRRMSRVLQR